MLRERIITIDLDEGNYRILRYKQYDNNQILKIIIQENKEEVDLAFYTANRLGIISPLYEQCLWDSKKMYEYGSLTYLNDENGYKYIEDATWMEIVNRAQKRSQIVAQCLFDEAEKGKVFLTKEQIENMLNIVLMNVSFEKVHFSGKFRT